MESAPVLPCIFPRASPCEVVTVDRFNSVSSLAQPQFRKVTRFTSLFIDQSAVLRSVTCLMVCKQNVYTFPSQVTVYSLHDWLTHKRLVNAEIKVVLPLEDIIFPWHREAKSKFQCQNVFPFRLLSCYPASRRFNDNKETELLRFESDIMWHKQQHCTEQEARGYPVGNQTTTG